MMTKKRYYLLITALVTSASSAANAACCDYCDGGLQDTYSEWKYGNFNALDVTNQDWEFDVCDNWDCGTYLDCGTHCSPDDVHSTTRCICSSVNHGFLANAICNGDDTCAAWLLDSSCGDDDVGSGGYIGSGNLPVTCNPGYWYDSSIDACRLCDKHHNATANSSGGTQPRTSCYIPSGRTFTDTNGTGSFTTNCYWKN